MRGGNNFKRRGVRGNKIEVGSAWEIRKEDRNNICRVRGRYSP